MSSVLTKVFDRAADNLARITGTRRMDMTTPPHPNRSEVEVPREAVAGLEIVYRHYGADRVQDLMRAALSELDAHIRRDPHTIVEASTRRSNGPDSPWRSLRRQICLRVDLLMRAEWFKARAEGKTPDVPVAADPTPRDLLRALVSAVGFEAPNVLARAGARAIDQAQEQLTKDRQALRNGVNTFEQPGRLVRPFAALEADIEATADRIRDGVARVERYQAAAEQFPQSFAEALAEFVDAIGHDKLALFVDDAKLEITAERVQTGEYGGDAEYEEAIARIGLSGSRDPKERQEQLEAARRATADRMSRDLSQAQRSRQSRATKASSDLHTLLQEPLTAWSTIGKLALERGRHFPAGFSNDFLDIANSATEACDMATLSEFLEHA